MLDSNMPTKPILCVGFVAKATRAAGVELDAFN